MSHDIMLAQLDGAVAKRWLRPLDLAFARFVSERDPHAAPALLLMAALTSRQLGDGHPCLDLRAMDALAIEHAWPASWVDALADSIPSSPLLAGPDGLPANAPLVLDGHRLYLRRYWSHECRVAHGIAMRLGHRELAIDALRDELDRLFPDAASDGVDWPRIACALAARSAFCVVTGGPGTGKTTTVVRLLGLLQTLQQRAQSSPLRIRLAAPTGKAAARLNASIARQIARLDVDERVRAVIPSEVETLHRLLGARPDSRQYAHDKQHPLHLDALVIDEASMVDLEMMAAVLDALPPQARLILIGDKDQLSSVEAGAVLGDLGGRVEDGHYSAETAEWIRAASGDDVSRQTSANALPLDQHVVMLRRSHRFGEDSGIGRLASAVNAGDAAEVHALLDGPHRDVAWVSADAAKAPLATLAIDGGGRRFDLAASEDRPHGFRFYLETLKRQRPPRDAGDADYRAWARHVLEAFNRFQLLCAVRHGPTGTERMNREIASALLADGLIDADRGWYEGRPVMMTRNDYSLGLMNGDVGIVLNMRGPDGEPRLYAAFPITRASSSAGSANDDAHIRCVSPTRLADVETVYAMTVHKSQGSEFEHTALVLPDEASPILTRELLYTGITRARRWLTLAGTPAGIDRALAQRTRRYSGLAERLGLEPI